MSIRAFTLVIFVASLCSSIVAAGVEDHATAIREVLKKAWHRPNWPLSVEPVVVDGDAALASWVQGHHGGRVLLRLEKGVWVPKLCGGDQLKTVATLVKAGVPESIADRLVRGLTKREASLSAEARRAIASYRGLLNMNERGSRAHR